MTYSHRIGAILLAALLAAPWMVSAAGAKKYQVTGKVLAVTDTMIVVEKGDEKWELNRDAATKVQGELKEGAKVTIEYTMSAAKIEVKADKAEPKPAPKSK